MDMNDYSESSLPYTGLPLGLGPLWAADEGPNFKSFDDMTETEKEHLILRCKDAKTTAEKQKVVKEMASDLDIRALADETGMNG